MNKCEHCSSMVSAETKFCSHCGRPLTSTDLDGTGLKDSADVPSFIAKMPLWLTCTVIALAFALILLVSSQPWKSESAQSVTRTPASVRSQITPPPVRTTVASPVTSIPEPSSKALEGSGVALQRVFSGPDLDFAFEYSSSQDGLPILSGSSPDDSASVIVFGNSSNPTSVTLLLSLPDTEDEGLALLTMTTYLYAFTSTAAPDWQGGTEWVSKAMADLATSEQYEAETWINGRRVSVGFIPIAGTFTVTFSAD